MTRGHLPPALLRVCPPVREILIVRRVGDLPEVGAIGSRRIDVLLVRVRQIQGEHNALAIGRPARLEREGATGACVQLDRVPAAAVRVDDVEPPLVVAGQDPLPVGRPARAPEVVPRQPPADLVQTAAVDVDDEQGDLLQVRVVAPEHDPGAVGRVVTGDVVPTVGVSGDPQQTTPIGGAHREDARGPIGMRVVPAIAGEPPTGGPCPTPQIEAWVGVV